MRRLAALSLLALSLAACGADGEPIRPTVTQSISLGSDGISTSTGIRVKRGPFSMGVQL